MVFFYNLFELAGRGRVSVKHQQQGSIPWDRTRISRLV